MKKMIFATRHMQDRPFSLGGRTFYSRLINGSEELDLTELDSLRTIAEKRSDSLMDEAQLIRRLLQERRRDKGDDVTVEWVTAHAGTASVQRLLGYLRGGAELKPGETLDLQAGPEPLVIDEQAFVPRAATYDELISAAIQVESLQAVNAAQVEPDLEAMTDLDEARAYVRAKLDDARTMNNVSAEILAGWLNARREEGTSPIDAAWLQYRLQLPDIAAISSYLSTGDLPEDDAPKDEAGDGE